MALIHDLVFEATSTILYRYTLAYKDGVFPSDMYIMGVAR